jgi:hypothetical protein
MALPETGRGITVTSLPQQGQSILEDLVNCSVGHWRELAAYVDGDLRCRGIRRESWLA